MLTNRYPNARQSTVIEAFEEGLNRFVESSSDIFAFEDWILERK